MSAPVSFTLAAPGPYLSMNDRSHWRTRARAVKAWRTAAARAAVPAAWFVYGVPQEVWVQLDVADKRRRDPHNLYPTVKALIDGMTDAGCWDDDTPEWVHTNEPTFRVVGRKVPLCVTVTMTERAA